MHKALVILFSLLLSGIAGAQDPKSAIKFEVPVLPGIARHLELLTVPGYAALALENNGLNPSLSSRLTIKGRDAFQIKAGTVRYTGKRGAVFVYEAGISLSFGVGESNFTIPVKVDTTDVSKGTLVVRVYPPLAKLLPQELLDRIEFKIRSLADLQSQQELLKYLDQLGSGEQAKRRGFEGVLEAIVLEAYNRTSQTAAMPGAASTPDRGGAEPLSDQALLLISILIWLVGFPIFLFVVRKRRKGSRPV